jgi:hypothetical protein
MAKKQIKTNISFEEERLILEERKVKSLEKIANTLDALTIWFEEIDKSGWDERIQYYMHEWHKHTIQDNDEDEEEE